MTIPIPGSGRVALRGRATDPLLHPLTDTMTITLHKDARATAVASIERYFKDEFDERIGNIRAAALLNFFIEEIGPSVYNQAVTEVQERLLNRVTEIDIECYEDEFGYWAKRRAK